MTDNSASNVLAKQRRRRRILMSLGDEHDGTPGKLEGLSPTVTETTFSNPKNADTTIGSDTQESSFDLQSTAFVQHVNKETSVPSSSTMSVVHTTATNSSRYHKEVGEKPISVHLVNPNLAQAQTAKNSDFPVWNNGIKEIVNNETEKILYSSSERTRYQSKYINRTKHGESHS